MKKTYRNFLVLVFTLLLGTASASTVSGVLLYLDNPQNPIPNTVVKLTNLSTQSVMTVVTDDNGNYEFTDVVPGNYRLSATTSLASGGVDLLDALEVLKYLIGQTSFTQIQLLAADVNGSGSVKLSDFVLIMNHLLHGTPFPVGNWVFETFNFTVSGTKEEPGGLSGSSSGDLTGVFVPGGRNLPAFPVEHNAKIAATAENEIEIPLITYDALELTGAGLIFNYPGNLISIESVEFPGNDFQYAISGDQLKLYWYGESDAPVSFSAGSALATLHCRTTAAFAPGTEADFSLDGSTCLAGGNYTKITGAKLGIPTITYAAPSLRISNYPNPFAESTMITYYLPEDGNVTIRIYSYTGQLVLTMPLSDRKEGYNQVNLDAANWLPGNYICRIQSNGSRNYNESRILIKTN
ncbi:MAG TPA: T9SS type A sorting domain-containing protein [Bacteroidales bacterium]|nr:T9SS type A sorting domain-containing protein [Bacteroidales bacterium]HPT02970.1 T9SS type A sorting domain-containing protein [Bacteroidales bacterium]